MTPSAASSSVRLDVQAPGPNSIVDRLVKVSEQTTWRGVRAYIGGEGERAVRQKGVGVWAAAEALCNGTQTEPSLMPAAGRLATRRVRAQPSGAAAHHVCDAGAPEVQHHNAGQHRRRLAPQGSAHERAVAGRVVPLRELG